MSRNSWRDSGKRFRTAKTRYLYAKEKTQSEESVRRRKAKEQMRNVFRTSISISLRKVGCMLVWLMTKGRS